MKGMRELIVAATILGTSHCANAAFYVEGEVNPSVNIVDSVLIVQMLGCMHYDFGAIGPSAFSQNANTTFGSWIGNEYETEAEVFDGRYGFYGIYRDSVGAEGVVVSMNPLFASTLINTATYDSLFNPEGYGPTESELIQAIRDSSSTNYDVYGPAQEILRRSYGTIIGQWVGEVNGSSVFGQQATLVCFSTASNGGSVYSVTQSVPEPATMTLLATGLALTIKRRRKTS